MATALQKTLEHGRVGTYKYHGCRCDECRQANTEYARQYARHGKKTHPQHGLTGYQRRGCRCDICQAARIEYLTRRRQRIEAIKLERGCADCGFNAHPECLDFDHVRGEKKFNLAQAQTRNWADVEMEIAKCDVVCANCHRLRTYQRRK